MKKVVFLTGIAAILLLSCDFFFWPAADESESSSRTKEFWAQDVSKDYNDPLYYYQIKASLLAENTYCKVWADTTSGVTRKTAQDVAAAFSGIYSKMIDVFGMSFREDDGKTYNTIQLADYYGDKDGKLCILLLDIKDGYEPGVNDSSVGGYFYSGDLVNFKNSNLCDMIYIDTNPWNPGRDESNIALTHELQHLMNLMTSIKLRSEIKDGVVYYSPMDLWINEGLSTAAEWVYLRKHPLQRYGWYYYNGDGWGAKGLIDKGNNFFVWGNREDENIYAVLDDYTTAYLFFQWLRIQKGGAGDGAGIYKDIISSKYSDYRAVTEAAKKINSSYSNWGNLLGDWLAANYDSSGSKAYKNDPELNLLNMHLLSTDEQIVNLYPGEGVFSMITDYYDTYEGWTSYAPSDSNIRYRVFKADSKTTDHQGTLLTFNANNSDKEESENGIITGVVIPEEDPESANASIMGRSALTHPFPRFRWIGAEDARRRNAASPSPAPLPLLRNNFTVSE